MSKITDLIKAKEFTFSFEVTPKLETDKLDSLSVKPSFFSITWHAKIHQNKDLDIPPIKLAKLLRSKNQNVLLHLSCDLLTKDYLIKLLTALQEHDIPNLFVMLGESYDGDQSEFKSTAALVKTIRDLTGNYFCIGVVGMPDCSDEKLAKLKTKIDAGADFVLTQAFFESNVFISFINRCRSIGIDVPVIPGLFCFDTYQQLNGFINLCKVKVSQKALDFVKEQELSGKSAGNHLTKDLINSIVNDSRIDNFHFFTLDKLDRVCTLIEEIKEKRF